MRQYLYNSRQTETVIIRQGCRRKPESDCTIIRTKERFALSIARDGNRVQPSKKVEGRKADISIKGAGYTQEVTQHQGISDIRNDSLQFEASGSVQRVGLGITETFSCGVYTIIGKKKSDPYKLVLLIIEQVLRDLLDERCGALLLSSFQVTCLNLVDYIIEGMLVRRETMLEQRKANHAKDWHR